MKRRTGIAYLLWLIGGWLGLHHFYLGRDRQAFVWWCTLGGLFGLGWLRDLFCIPRYVEEANEDEAYIESYTERLRSGKGPPFSVSRFAGQLFIGAFFGYLGISTVPYEFVEEIPLIRVLVVPLAVALGVHLVGNIGREEGSYKNALIGAFIVAVVMFNNNIVHLAISSAICFRRGVTYRRTPERWKTVGLCKRVFVFSLAGSLLFCAWGSAIYFNMSVTTNDGETIKVRDALDHFFDSPAWKDFKMVLWEIVNLIRERGWKEAYSEFVQSLDPEGETAAYLALELEEGASQEAITQRYRKLVRTWHPDKHKGADKEEAAQKFMRIQKSYERLSEINARRTSKKQHSFDEEETRAY